MLKTERIVQRVFQELLPIRDTSDRRETTWSGFRVLTSGFRLYNESHIAIPIEVAMLEVERFQAFVDD